MRAPKVQVCVLEQSLGDKQEGKLQKDAESKSGDEAVHGPDLLGAWAKRRLQGTSHTLGGPSLEKQPTYPSGREPGIPDFRSFQTLASSGIWVFRLCRRDQSGSRKVQAFQAGGGSGRLSCPCWAEHTAGTPPPPTPAASPA